MFLELILLKSFDLFLILLKFVDLSLISGIGKKSEKWR